MESERASIEIERTEAQLMVITNAIIDLKKNTRIVFILLYIFLITNGKKCAIIYELINQLIKTN